VRDSTLAVLAGHLARAGERVDVALRAAEAAPYRVATQPEVAELRRLSPDLLCSVVVALFEQAIERPSLVQRLRGASNRRSRPYAAIDVLRSLGGRRLPWTRDDAQLLLEMAATALSQMEHHEEWRVITLVGQPLAATERAVEAGGIGELAGPISAVIDGLGRFEQYSRGQAAKYRGRLVALLEAGGAGVDPNLFDPTDTWGKAWTARASDFGAELAPLLASLGLVTSVTPTAAWRKRAADAIRAQGAGLLLHQMLAEAPGSETLRPPTVYHVGREDLVLAAPPLGDQNVIVLRGAIWAAVILAEPWVVDALTTIGLHFGTSARGDNVARDERLANTGAAALGSLDDPAAFAALGRMKARVTNRNVSKQIARALEAAAERAGLSASELLELAVPDHGLDSDGRREIPVGDHVAVLAVEGDEATPTWRGPDGRASPRPPAAVAAANKAAVTRVKDELKELRKGLAIERGRIEDLFVEAREWAISDWRARYLDHPLTATLGRRLIWTFVDGESGGEVTAIPAAGGLETADGTAFEPGEGARVRLWHPIHAPEALIAAWRARLLAARIRQPFKQAFREVYIVTPAEAETGRYSNRFAAHILRYPQARALMTARRWGSNFLGPFDGGDVGVAKRDFPSHGLRAEFWHGQLEAEFGIEAVQHCTTDQVRFLRLGPPRTPEEVVPVGEVPAIVFSEAMRDVDLFVSVTSVGADRNWQDGGRREVPPLDGYWAGYWTGDLTATSIVRRDALERMLPGLAIADRLALEDRWLIVRGDLRTYRIHLGSGNILMEPSDTYLCIVPARGGAAERVFLPFDDDPTLSVILSKAFMLAADKRITDPSIVSQIRRG
jgi:Domain of unknown function (DUF4132)